MKIYKLDHDKHFHMVVEVGGRFLFDDKEQDHTHSIEIDQITGEPYCTAVESKRYGVHSHGIMEAKEVEPKIKEGDNHQNIRLRDLYTYYETAKETWNETRQDMKTAEDYYMGKQWTDAEIKAMEDKNKAPVVLNFSESMVDILSGTQRQERTDIRLLPTETTDQRAADLMTSVVKHILYQNDYKYHESEVFEDGTITGWGFFSLYQDFERDIEGEVKVKRRRWQNVLPGPFHEKDWSDLEYLFKTEMVSLSKLKSLYPEHELELKSVFQAGENSDEVSDEENEIVIPVDCIDKAAKSIKVLELWEKEYYPDYMLISEEYGDAVSANLAEEERNRLETIPELEIIRRSKFRIKTMTVAGRSILDENYPDLPIQEFHVIPFIAKMRRFTVWGKLKPVKDIQDLINKFNSQAVDIVNRCASYGWFIDKHTFASKKEMKKFKDKSSTPGFVSELTNVNRQPSQVEGVKFPSEITAMIDRLITMYRQITNVIPELHGISQREESGIALNEKKNAAMTGNKFLFDNLSYAKKLLVRVLIANIQDLYTPEKMARIVINHKQLEKLQEIKIQKREPTPEEMQGIQAMDQQLQEIAEILSNKDFTKCDIYIAEDPYSPSTRRANFKQWAEMAQQGVQVPMQLLIELSDLPEKDVVLNLLAQMQQQQAAQEQGKQQTEIQKTMIANQNRGVPNA